MNDNPITQSEMPVLEEEALAKLLTAMPAGVLLEDGDGRILWLNPELERQLGVNARAVIGASSMGLPVRPVLDREHPADEYLAVGPEAGAERLRAQRVELDSQSAGRCMAYLFARLALDEERPARESLLHMLAGRAARDSIDAETGMLDQNGIMQVLAAEVSRSRRYSNPLSIAMMRVSPQTPQARVEVMMADSARLLREHMRWADSIGRFSESEFLLILPETGAEGVSSLVGKIKAQIDENTVTYRTTLVSATWQRGENAQLFLERVRQSLSSSTDLN